jgi:hypothetical protein
MFVIAIAFITSTIGLLIAPLIEALWRKFGRRTGGRA